MPERTIARHAVTIAGKDRVIVTDATIAAAASAHSKAAAAVVKEAAAIAISKIAETARHSAKKSPPHPASA